MDYWYINSNAVCCGSKRMQQIHNISLFVLANGTNFMSMHTHFKFVSAYVMTNIQTQKYETPA